MYNYTALQARATVLASFGGWTDVTPGPDWPTLVNQAWQEFSWAAECVIGSETLAAVSGQAQYQLSNTYKAILDVTFNGLPLIRSSEEYERNLNPFWLNQPGGTPKRWTLSAFSQFTMIPPPSGTQTITVRGVQQGALMVAGTDYPGQVSGSGIAIPANFHDAVAYRAAVLHGQLFAQGEEMQRLNAYMTQYDKFVDDCRECLTGGTMRRTNGS